MNRWTLTYAEGQRQSVRSAGRRWLGIKTDLCVTGLLISRPQLYRAVVAWGATNLTAHHRFGSPFGWLLERSGSDWPHLVPSARTAHCYCSCRVTKPCFIRTGARGRARRLLLDKINTQQQWSTRARSKAALRFLRNPRRRRRRRGNKYWKNKSKTAHGDARFVRSSRGAEVRLFGCVIGKLGLRCRCCHPPALCMSLKNHRIRLILRRIRVRSPGQGRWSAPGARTSPTEHV